MKNVGTEGDYEVDSWGQWEKSSSIIRFFHFLYLLIEFAEYTDNAQLKKQKYNLNKLDIQSYNIIVRNIFDKQWNKNKQSWNKYIVN